MTSGDSIGFSGSTLARLALLNNADFNTKEFIYLDTDLHIQMLYFPLDMQYYQYSGQKMDDSVRANPNPANGEVLIGTERVYTWDGTNKFWKTQISSYLRKYAPAVNGFVAEELNGVELRISLNATSGMKLSLYQKKGMDKISYSIANNAPVKVPLSVGTEKVILPDVPKAQPIPLTVYLMNEGYGIAVTLMRFENTVFLLNFQKVITGDACVVNMTTAERKLFKNDTDNPHEKKSVYDTDLDLSLMYRPKVGSIGTFIQDIGQREIAQFPTTGLTDGKSFLSSSSAIEYTYHLNDDYWSCKIGYNQSLDTDDNVGFNSIYAESELYAPDITSEKLTAYNNYLYNKYLKAPMSLPKMPQEVITEAEGLMFKVTDGNAGWYHYSDVAKQIVPWLYDTVLDDSVQVITQLADDNSQNIASTAFVQAVLAAFVGAAPATLDTLKEIATALGNDPNFATTMTNLIATKASLNSPDFAGAPRAPTPESSSNSNRIATTEYVKAQFPGGTLVSTTGTQTLTNKTLTSPSIVDPSISTTSNSGLLMNLAGNPWFIIQCLSMDVDVKLIMRNGHTGWTHIAGGGGDYYLFPAEKNWWDGLKIFRSNPTTWASASDIRLKHDIVTLENSLDKILKLHPVEYSMNGVERRQIGLIAQEVEDIFPLCVMPPTDTSEDADEKDKYYSMTYDRLVMYVINAMQEQQKIIDSMQARLNKLEKD